MNLLLHLIIVAAYLTVAGAAAAGVPQALFAIGPEESRLIAGAALLVGLLLQLALAHGSQGRRLAGLAERCDGLGRDLSAARRELEAVRNALFDADPETLRLLLSRTPAEIEAERKILHLLRRQLERSEAEATVQAPAPPADAAPAEAAKAWQPAEAEASPREPLARPAPAQMLHRLGAAFDVEEEPAGRREPPPIDSASSLSSREGRAVFEALLEAVRHNQIDVYLQPVVRLPSRRVAFYESFSRITDETGKTIGGERYIPIAEEAELISAIDNNLLFRCVQLVRMTRRHNRDYGFFCNTSIHTLKDETFFPQFIEFMEGNRALADALIFEFAEPEITARDPQVMANLRRLAQAGFRFSLDRVSRLDLDFTDLAERRFRFIKIEAGMLKALMNRDESGPMLALFQRTLARAGIEVVVEKIETEAMLVELLDLSFAYGQGYLFGQPRLSRATAA